MNDNVEVQEVQKYQWIKGEKLGKIVELESTVIENDITFLKFNDGSRCNEAVIGEYMLDLSVDEPLDLKLPKAPHAQKLATNNKVLSTNNTIKKSIDSLLKKSESKSMSITIDVPIPNKAIFEFLYEMHGEDFKNAIIKRLIDKSSDNIMDAICNLIEDELQLNLKENEQERTSENGEEK